MQCAVSIGCHVVGGGLSRSLVLSCDDGTMNRSTRCTRNAVFEMTVPCCSPLSFWCCLHICRLITSNHFLCKHTLCHVKWEFYSHLCPAPQADHPTITSCIFNWCGKCVLGYSSAWYGTGQAALLLQQLTSRESGTSTSLTSVGPKNVLTFCLSFFPCTIDCFFVCVCASFVAPGSAISRVKSSVGLNYLLTIIIGRSINCYRSWVCVFFFNLFDSI